MAYNVDMNIPPSEYYRDFVEQDKIRLNFFEKSCKFARKILKIPAPEFMTKKLKDSIYLSGIKVSADEVFSLTILSFIASVLLLGPLIFFDLPSSLMFLIFPPFIAYNVFTYPIFYSDVIRIRAGNETVSIILYMVTYLSLTPVYDNAIQFTASCSHGPIGNDLKKVVWDVKAGKYTTIKDGISAYVKKWSLWNTEFINCLILLRMIEMQSSAKGRNAILDRAAERIMTHTYTMMEDYAFKLKVPSTLIMLFGIMLPLMGLIMFPIVSVFLTASVNPFYIGLGYIIILPFFMWWALYRMIAKRPAAYSHSEKLEQVEPNKYIEIKSLKLRIPILPIAILIGFIISIPGIMYFLELYSVHANFFSQYPLPIAQSAWSEYCLSRYEPKNMVNDTFRAMFVPWGVAVSLIFLTWFRSKGPYEFGEFIKLLEKDFATGLFELQSALSQNISFESALLKVLDQYKILKKEKSPMALFFLDLYVKIVKFAVNVKEALFGKEGLVHRLPSAMIKHILGIVVSALVKGPMIAAGVIKNIVSYLIKLEEIEHIIKRSMKDIVSNLTMQGNFITPVISAIVASSAVLIIQLLQAVARAIQALEKMYSFGTNVGGGMSDTLAFIDFKSVMPPTVMQLIAGLYLIEIIVITAIFITGISRGFNKVYRDHLIARIMIVGMLLFTLIFFIMVLMFQPIITQIKV